MCYTCINNCNLMVYKRNGDGVMLEVFALLGAGILKSISSAMEGINEANTKQKSYEKNGWAVSDKGKKYYNGEWAYRCVDKNGHEIVKSYKTGMVLMDYTLEEKRKDAIRNKKIWDEALEKARKENKKCFMYITLDEMYGLYETETLKRISIITYGNTHCKYYYKINTPSRNEIDFNSKVVLSYDEWMEYGGKCYDETYN